ncbi:MAG: metalloendopeptidase [Bacteroidetes bacterium HGW-Bacteroidetes-16]|jgi:murein DD-endopeptidase MepM/ murein hydrolase activator NlpD|nr:MAG: metalloendopeptidase [Bacteroidetes bacterium HGW-Bacteroidetes-16]
MVRYFLPGFLFVLFVISACQFSPDENTATGNQSETVVQEPQWAYGIVVDSLDVKEGIVKNNEFLSDILLRHGVSYDIIDYLARHTRDTFDVRRIKSGNRYAVMCKRDSIATPVYFAYEISPITYVLYALNDTISASIGRKSIDVVNDTLEGVIESSLWNSLVAKGADPNLANELSEIYAWTIDFFGLQKGDVYKAIYTKQYVEGQYIGLGRVEATLMLHGGDSLYAFYFIQNEKGDYFDEKGASLQRAFLKAPLRFTRISSHFSNSRLHPVLKIRRPHHGVDYAAAEGTPVYSVGDGTIVKRAYQKLGGGNYLTIRHNGTYSTTYMHLKGYAKGIAVGKHVRQGELIGYVGRTGLATGAHLDFRFYRNGKAVDPLKVESPPSLPIDAAYRASFDSLVGVYKTRLAF